MLRKRKMPQPQRSAAMLPERQPCWKASRMLSASLQRGPATMRTVRSTAVMLGGLILSFTAAQAGILIPVPPFPGSTATYIRAINDKNVITGYYTMADGLPHGFVGTLDGKYTSFDASESGTIPLGIANDGHITIGSNLSIDCPVSGCGFIRAPDGTISQVHKGKKMLDGVVQGILNRSRFVGDYGVDGTPGAPNLHP